MIRLASFRELHEHRHTLGLYCIACNRWETADLARLIALGRGEMLTVDARFRCRDCGALADKQLRPPVPVPGGSMRYV